MEDDLIKIGTTGLTKAEKIKGAMRQHGIRLEILLDKEHCGRGCDMRVELWGRAEDIPAIQEIMAKEYANSLDGLEYDPETINQVFDPEKETAICPACGHEFSTKSEECPECGLNFQQG
ncbi:MAG: hypothetical protein HQK54_08935 [Oligoflexales bacterium]|nr:hypothetical protein [Oligoflexales bacterium]